MKGWLSSLGLLIGLGISLSPAWGQPPRSSQKIVRELKADIEYLASEELAGRLVGSPQEKMAADFLESRMKEAGLSPYRGAYQHPFDFVAGKSVHPSTRMLVNGMALSKETDFSPLSFSASGTRSASRGIPEVYEKGEIWIMPAYADEAEARDAHFDWEKSLFDRTREAKDKGATALIFFDAYETPYPPRFLPRSSFETLDIPVVFLSRSGYDRLLEAASPGANIVLTVQIDQEEQKGINVTGYLDHGRPLTVVLGAHYDHLGWGEGGNSLHHGGERAIHHGADDNASGTAGLIQLGSWISRWKDPQYNYLFIGFSGEEFGLLGSKAIVEQYGLDSQRVAYMINMDMIGRLEDSTQALTIGGVGTSPSWYSYTRTDQFRIAVDSAGIGPSDHSSFYQAGVPVLFFFTGLHTDYHKPSDLPSKINYEGQAKLLRYIYSVVESMEKRPRPEYQRTRQPQMGRVRFKVTLGIMPDYTFTGSGVKADGVLENRPAHKAGLQDGDRIIRIGEWEVKGMQTYMEALSQFKGGETTEVEVVRDGENLVFPLVFD